MLSILLQIEEFTVYFSYFVADISVHTLRAEPLLSLFWRDRKRGSAQICFIVWSRRSPKSWASHSGLWLSNWFYECEHQLLREADGRNWAHGIQRKHGGKALAKGGPSKRLTCSHTFYQVFHLSDRYFRVLAHSHWSRKIFHFIRLSTFADGRKRVANNLKALGTLILSAHPSDVVTCVTTNCQVFGMNCLRLEEFKQGDPGNLSFFQ